MNFVQLMKKHHFKIYIYNMSFFDDIENDIITSDIIDSEVNNTLFGIYDIVDVKDENTFAEYICSVSQICTVLNKLRDFIILCGESNCIISNMLLQRFFEDLEIDSCNNIRYHISSIFTDYVVTRHNHYINKPFVHLICQFDVIDGNIQLMIKVNNGSVQSNNQYDILYIKTFTIENFINNSNMCIYKKDIINNIISSLSIYNKYIHCLPY